MRFYFLSDWTFYYVLLTICAYPLQFVPVCGRALQGWSNNSAEHTSRTNRVQYNLHGVGRPQL